MGDAKIAGDCERRLALHLVAEDRNGRQVAADLIGTMGLTAKIAPDVAFTYVSGAVGAGLSALMKLLEAKFSWAKRILLAKKPAALS